MIVKCTCTDGPAAAFQDNKYGKNMRAHNPTVKEPKGSHWRCTICGKENSKTAPSADKKGKN